MNEPTLEDLVVEMRKTATTDVDLAQRVALLCALLAETKTKPGAAIRAAFRIH